MINFIVCDDNSGILIEVNKVINNLMMKNNIGYKIHLFEDYYYNFDTIPDLKMSNKIYILDIESYTSSGLDIARKIRNNDYNSTIIFLTANEKICYKILQRDFLFSFFISKKRDYKIKLSNALNAVLKKINSSQIIKCIKNGIIYIIPLDDILYITRDSVERKSIIKTEYLEIMISKKLKDIKRELNSNFTYSHRSCIVNKLRIRAIDIKKHIIIFSNNDQIDLVSRIFKKGYKYK